MSFSTDAPTFFIAMLVASGVVFFAFVAWVKNRVSVVDLSRPLDSSMMSKSPLPREPAREMGRTPPRPTAPSQSNEGLGEVARLAQAGKLMEALKLYRKIGGGSLKDAKEFIERLR